MCGAPDCRGTLDANPQRGLNRGRRIEVLWDDGVFYAATVAAFFTGSGKFRLVYDDGDTETVRLEADPARRRDDDVVWRWLEDEGATGNDGVAIGATPPADEGAAQALSADGTATPGGVGKPVPDAADEPELHLTAGVQAVIQ
jgi:hypothetical protein